MRCRGKCWLVEDPAWFGIVYKLLFILHFELNRHFSPVSSDGWMSANLIWGIKKQHSVDKRGPIVLWTSFLIFYLCGLSTAWRRLILRPRTHQLPLPILAGSSSEQTRCQTPRLQGAPQIPHPASCQTGGRSNIRWVWFPLRIASHHIKMIS